MNLFASDMYYKQHRQGTFAELNLIGILINYPVMAFMGYFLNKTNSVNKRGRVLIYLLDRPRVRNLVPVLNLLALCILRTVHSLLSTLQESRSLITEIERRVQI